MIDVYPDGRAYNLQDGLMRARYREGYDKKVWMKQDEVYEVRIDLHAMSNYFAPGHRIRLEVSSSNFPRLDRNLNTGGNNYDEHRGLWRRTESIIRPSIRRICSCLLSLSGNRWRYTVTRRGSVLVFFL